MDRVRKQLDLIAGSGVTCVETTGASPEPLMPLLREAAGPIYKVPPDRRCTGARRGCGGDGHPPARGRWSHRKYKEFLADAKGTEGTVVKKAMRDHHRVLRNDSARTVKALDAAGVTDFEQFRPHVMGALAHDAYLTGDASRGMLDFGPAAMFADCLEPMESILDGLIDDADAAAQWLQSPQATVP